MQGLFSANPHILIKSTLLVAAASIIANRTQKVTLALLTLVVLAYQIIGTAIEWAIVKDFYVAIQDFRIGVPGMAIQIIGGYLVLKGIKR